MAMTPAETKRDCGRYERIQSGMSRCRASLGSEIDPTKNHTYMKLWRELEMLKNQHGGHAPAETQTTKAAQ